MRPQKNDILQGTLVLLVLRTLATNGRMHGYAITAHIHRVSAELLRVEEGSLYPALHRMEQQGWLRSEWGLTEKNREARFYAVTAAGRKQLADEEASWSRLTAGVQRVLRHASEGATS
jgi:PadR family transcriptional regulator, regulatory protein PadR